jgi:hypothetical protein
MAAGQGFKTFATGDVLTAADTNGYLMQGVWVFANAAARTAAVTSPQEGNMSFLKDTNSTEYYSGSAWVAVAGAAGGKVLQVVNASSTTATSITSGTFTDSTVTASITPTSATSTILVLADFPIYLLKTASGTFIEGDIRLNRGATQIALSNQLLEGATVSNMGIIHKQTFMVMDSPATTSATTYMVQGRITTGAQIRIVKTGEIGSITLLEIGA